MPMQDLATLKAAMDAVENGFQGTLGYSLHHRGRGEAIDLRGDEPFPTASTIKTAVMGAVLHEIESGRLRWSEELTVPPEPSGRQEGGYAYYFSPGASLSLAHWLDLMITVSDNTATMLLRETIGQDTVNRWLDAHGLTQTRLLNGSQKAELGLLPLQQKFGLGVTTPQEMGRLLELIRDGQAGTPAACDRMLRLLSHQYYDDCIARVLPPDVQIANKTGAVDRSRSDSAYVFSPSGEYVLTVYTKEQEDQRWEPDNAGETAIRALSALVWRHYHPDHSWTLPTGAERLGP